MSVEDRLYALAKKMMSEVAELDEVEQKALLAKLTVKNTALRDKIDAQRKEIFSLKYQNLVDKTSSYIK